MLVCIATSSFAQVKVDSIGRVTNGDTINSFVRTTMLSEGTAYKHDLSVHNPEGYTHFDITDGKLTNPQQCYFRRDHLGSNVAVWNAARDTTVQRTWYYASGTPMSNGTGQSAQSYKYNGKEFVEIFGNNTYDYGFRGYHAITGRFTTMDPLAEKFYDISPYAYCGGNPIRYIDILGLDTISITYDSDNEKWQISDPIIAEGDDVFIVTENGESSTYTFSEGEYGKRVNTLTLSYGATKDDESFGVYHISGTQVGGTGFYVTRGGNSLEKGSGVGVPEGDYPIIVPHKEADWQQLGLGGKIISRGIRFHPGKSYKWSEGCYILFTRYIKKDGITSFDLSNSRSAVKNFNLLLGADPHNADFQYKSTKNGRDRYGASFPNGNPDVRLYQKYRK